MSSFSLLGAPSKQIFEQMQPVFGVWEFPAEALQGVGLADCSERPQGSSEHRQAEGGGRKRRCTCSARSEVLAAAALGLAPQRRRCEQSRGLGAAELRTEWLRFWHRKGFKSEQ